MSYKFFDYGCDEMSSIFNDLEHAMMEETDKELYPAYAEVLSSINHAMHYTKLFDSYLSEELTKEELLDKFNKLFKYEKIKIFTK